MAAAHGLIGKAGGPNSQGMRSRAQRHKPTRKPSILETRKRLINTSDRPPELQYELLLMFARNELAAQWTILVLALIFSLASMFWAPEREAIIWLIVVVTTKIALLEVCRKFAQLPKADADAKLWYRRLFVAEAASGLAWACFALIGNGTNAVGDQGYILSSHVFLFASLIVLLAIRMTFASTVLPLLYVGTIPMTLAVVARLTIQQDFFYFALASLAVGVHIYFIFLAKGLQTTAVSMLEYRLQKDLLISELAEEKTTSDLARQRAEDANLAKSRFLATMSHELRTPLNAVLGFSEVMKSELLGPMDNKSYKEYAENIHSSGAHLLHLINEILDLSRVEAGKYDMSEKPIGLAEIVDDCRRLLHLRAETKGLKIIERYSPEMAPLWADERAVRQICLNLMSNAVKFTPRGGSVTLVIETTAEGEQMICVSDTGPGIPKDEIPKVLEAFGQGSLAHETAEGGTGLGLPIVHKLVELHGGRLDLRSELRKGTIATVYFPRIRNMERLGPLADPNRAGRSGSEHPGRSHDLAHPRRPRRLVRARQQPETDRSATG
ncbi:MAG: sensor histidine kinase [Hyphomicrobiaceae bacterium]